MRDFVSRGWGLGAVILMVGLAISAAGVLIPVFPVQSFGLLGVLCLVPLVFMAADQHLIAKFVLEGGDRLVPYSLRAVALLLSSAGLWYYVNLWSHGSTLFRYDNQYSTAAHLTYYLYVFITFAGIYYNQSTKFRRQRRRKLAHVLNLV